RTHGWLSISSIVKRRLKDDVLSVDLSGALVWRPISGWYRSGLGRRRWIRLSLKYGKLSKLGVRYQAVVTDDHAILTPNGWCAAGELKTDELVVTGEPAPNLAQRELLDGTMLGDASISRRNFSVGHVDKDYVMAKYLAFKSLGAKIHGPYKNKHSTVGARPFWRVDLPSAMWIAVQKKRWYPEGKKRVPRDLKITPMLLAAWYFDDGTGGYGKTSSFATHGFLREDVEWLSAKLKGFGVPNTVVGMEERGCLIRLGHAATRKLMLIISDYAPASMRRKIGARISFRRELWELGEPMAGVQPVIVEESEDKLENAFCIDVKDTQNFVSPTAVLHNCTQFNQDTALIFINQLRNDMGVTFGNPERLPGGKGLKFHVSLMVRTRRGAWLTDADMAEDELPDLDTVLQ
ncbi:hypothetical protein LCGC14_2819230, partial [marine sediment metagenome]